MNEQNNNGKPIDENVPERKENINEEKMKIENNGQARNNTDEERKDNGAFGQKSDFVREDELPGSAKLIGEEYIKEELRKPLGVFSYFFIPILLMLPVVNIIFVFTWVFGRYVNENLKRIGIAALIWYILILLTLIFFGESLFTLFGNWIDTIAHV
ncbi:MAG: hypothetical protein ACOX3Q_00095 [Clostridia bacterium]|mgnify:CR=1 FL=1|jgi:hypothetical protein